MRNLIAISISAAVVGFAAHEVGVQWKNSRSDDAGLMQQVSADATGPNFTGTITKAPAAVQTYAFQRIPESPVADEPVTKTAVNMDDEFRTEVEEAEQPLTSGKAEAISAATGSASLQTTAAVPAETQAPSALDEQTMMGRGMALLDAGDIAGARLFFQHLASRGSALGAIALARTYDARFINGISVNGPLPDVAMARKWYQRAADLGSREATAYLSSLQ